MASTASGAQWSWPTDMDSQASGASNGASGTAHEASFSGSPTSSHPPGTHPETFEETSEGASENTGAASSSNERAAPSQRQRHYRPRTCRICLDEVQPTTEIDDSLAGRVFASRTRVRYVSDDPELGRLISPCKCKGSQRYVHEGCLQAWRRSQPLSDRHYWQCPTCLFQYRMERLRWSQWISSKLLRVVLTILILIATVFLLGFIADPIISLWTDPFGVVVDSIFDYDDDEDYDIHIPGFHDEDETSSWAFHFFKGFASLGVLGCIKMFAMSPWRWFGTRVGGGRRRATGRDRVESISWVIIIMGVMTFLGATWKLVNHYTSVVLEKASDRVVDIQGDDDDEDEDDQANDAAPEPPQESRKDR